MNATVRETLRQEERYQGRWGKATLKEQNEKEGASEYCWANYKEPVTQKGNGTDEGEHELPRVVVAYVAVYVDYEQGAKF